MARKILLADDSVTAQNMGRKILADAGYEVLTVNNGSAALKKIAEGKPDLIILDVYMPGYSGLEVCQRLKEASETARIPILLTVGKLEPFKPEEAKRVRAEGYIVKPFEASELLSALSKLEDKIVPRAEASKQGRFARAIAAVEGRDPIVSGEEDTSWKERIAFPSGKKKESLAREADVDDSAIYNPVNKDLRTTVEAAPAPQDAKPESRVNLEALAHQGLPKDVTPEEIAALAAAAAQIQGTIAESSTAQTSTTENQPKIVAEGAGEKQDATQPPAAQLSTAVPPVSAVAEKFTKDETEASAEDQRNEQESRALSFLSPANGIDAELAADISRELDTRETGSGNGSWRRPTEDEPVTMAAISAAELPGASSRWIAVPVALLPEETAVSLEEEMQRAFAAAPAAPSSVISESQTAVALLSPDPPAAEPFVPTQVSPVPEAAHSTSPEAATHGAVKAFETVGVASAITDPQPPVAAEPESVAPQAVETASQSISEESPIGGAVAEGRAGNQAAAPEESARETETPQPVPAEHIPAEVLPAAASVAGDFAQETAGMPEHADMPAISQGNEAPEAQALASQVSVVESPVPAESAAGRTEQAPEKEPDMAAATAAAWASWRKIRESGDHTSSSSAEPPKIEAEPETPAPQDEAAMAVAAGAEKAPEAAPDEGESDPTEIANIVESVLADLRPKIVAEISRKLGKKK